MQTDVSYMSPMQLSPFVLFSWGISQRKEISSDTVLSLAKNISHHCRLWWHGNVQIYEEMVTFALWAFISYAERGFLGNVSSVTTEPLLHALPFIS